MHGPEAHDQQLHAVLACPSALCTSSWVVNKGIAHNKCLPHQLSFIVYGEGQGFGMLA